jgi:hypothetical protein
MPPTAIFLIVFFLTFASIQIIIAYNCEHWVNLTFASAVLLSVVVMKPVIKLCISWAVFPYSNWLVGLSHEQDINR